MSTTTLYRPTGDEELALVEASGFAACLSQREVASTFAGKGWLSHAGKSRP